MSKKNKLKEFIKNLIREYTGTGASGGNAGDGNNITSPRPFADDLEEIENYIYKNVYGAEGGQWVGNQASSTFNRTPNVRYESLKKYIKEALKELEEQAYGSATLTTQGQSIHRAPGVWEEEEEELDLILGDEGSLKEQVSAAAQRTYEAGLKRLQKNVLRYQVRWIEKQRAAAVSQAATAQSQTSKGFDDQIKALQDQIAAIDNPPKQKQNENLIQNYINERKTVDLMRYMDSYKREILLEGTVRKLFRKFAKDKTNEEITKEYAQKGVKIPEQFLSKIRKQYENLKKLKLEIDLADQEANNVIIIPTKSPDIQLFDLEPEEEEEKQLSSRLERIKEQKIVKRYDIPPEIKSTLEDTLEMYPLIRYVKGLKAVNSIPPSYRVFLLNGNHFDIIYEDYSLKLKIGIDEYWMGDIEGINYAKKHINRLLTKPILKKQEEEDEETEGGPSPSPPATGAPSPPPPSPPPADEEPEEQTIVIFITNRHPKDILRSFCHEMIHHIQNERGDLNMGDSSSPTYAQDDKHMRNMEKEAYLEGNLLLRDFEDNKKYN